MENLTSHIVCASRGCLGSCLWSRPVRACGQSELGLLSPVLETTFWNSRKIKRNYTYQKLQIGTVHRLHRLLVLDKEHVLQGGKSLSVISTSDLSSRWIISFY